MTDAPTTTAPVWTWCPTCMERTDHMIKTEPAAVLLVCGECGRQTEIHRCEETDERR